MDVFSPTMAAIDSTIENSSGCNSSYHHRDDAAFEGSRTLPSIFKLAREGGDLSDVSAERLQHSLEPVVARLQQIDAEALLHLRRVESNGARLRDG